MTDVNHLRSDIATRGGSPPDRAIAALAVRQHGVVAYVQLRALGFTQGAIKHRVAAGRLHGVHVGVYAVGHRMLTANGHRMAAVLACGPDAMLSHRSAASLHALRQNARAAIDITVPRPRARSRPGIDVHRVRHLHPADRTAVDGIPTTTVARTLLDLAEVTRAGDVERAVEEAERQRLLDLASFDALFARSAGRRGLRATRAALSELNAGTEHTRSELEAAFLRFCATHGIPRPQLNVQVAGFLVDALWPEQRLIVELDGYAFHGTTRQAFERDRIKDAELQRTGHRVVRLTWRPHPCGARRRGGDAERVAR